MRQDSSPGETPVALAAGSVADTPVGTSGVVGQAEGGTVTLPRLKPIGLRAMLPRGEVATGPTAGRIALATLIVGTLSVVVLATAGPSVLVPRSAQVYPNWESGPLHNLFGRLITNSMAMGLVFSGLLVVMVVAYVVVLAASRALSMRTIAICIVALHLILLLSPPLQLSDLFNYIGYARLGGLHHMNPYTHVIRGELHDPVFLFTSWHNLRSPYGPLFTAVTYLVSYTSLPVAYWTLKILTVLLSLVFLALVWFCARKLGRDPRFAVLFVAANPIYLIYEVGGFHNDFFMLVPSMAAIALLLARRDRLAGATLMVAVAVKFTAVLLLPFLLIAARPMRRKVHILVGAALATVPLAALSLSLFGLSIPNLSDQSSLLTDFSFPNLFGLLIGIGGGTPGLLHLASFAVVVVVAYEVYRRRDWLTGAGWCTLALIVSLAWLVPWYVVWLLPLAALGTSVRLRRVAVALTVFLVLSFIPATELYLKSHRIDPLASSVGQASTSRQHKLAQ
jgi:hypothetical protein